MIKRYVKIISTISFAVLLIGSMNLTYATSVNTTNTNFQNGQMPQKPENEITGKITYIDATNIVISVATRKEMQKPENGQGNMPPEMMQNGQGNMPPEVMQNGQMGTPPQKPNGDTTNGTSLQKPNLDDMYTLTGESKTINIATADFGIKHNTNSNGQTSTNEIKKTYADYVVGDYVNIETTDSTYTVAKNIRDAHEMGPRMGFGNPPQQMNNNNAQ